MADDVRNVVIIGSGPAGLTAAIYTARARLNPLVISGFMKGGSAGGQLMTTTEVENFPGYPEGVTGPEMMMDLRNQAERFGTEFMDGVDIEDVDLSQRPFTLKHSDGEIKTKSIIIATGARANYLGLPSEQKYLNKGVSACATCDGALPMFRDKPIVVVGGGDSAIEEATFLTRFGSRVYLVHRRDELRASKIMQEKAFNNPKLEIVWDTVVEEVLGDDFVNGVRLKNVKTGEVKEMPIAGFFLGIGHTPNTDVFEGKLDLDDKKYLVVKGRTSYTSVEGVFAAGDVHDSIYRQAITAAGAGCAAAIDVERWLEAQEA